ncbi:glycoside hydrolase family 26 protein [Marinimicrobium sp. LS-A18]|uniref:glycoside hydrolase family 26 protein n=1 Tax=Marinimicrobium sp. LS-A18 TaxID=1381596 RepID=UPI000464AB1F|nr:glycosyl hydrolase [Marinimicrobium sp. LS-A18]
MVRTTVFHGLLAGLVALLTACSALRSDAPQQNAGSAEPITENIDPAAQALWRNLHRLKGEGFLFGHQDSLAYGVQWRDDSGRSDVRLTTGDYPALYGWDLGHLELNDARNLDGVPFARMRDWMRDAYRRGGVVSISWHMTHPGTGSSSWETDAGAAELLPGGRYHQDLRLALDQFAAFARSQEVSLPDGRTGPMPLIFRPWHEHNGDWFWWGKGPTSEEDYRALWRFTVDYLTQEQQLHQLLYAFSPDRSRLTLDQFESSYLYGYPGDDYVDILGIDNYWDLGHSANTATPEEDAERFIASLGALAKLAAQRGKLAAMTEGGQDTLFESDFFTERLLKGWQANEWTRQIVYMQVWRNANRERESRDHFYVPYPDHPAADDFIEFYQHPATLFEADLPPLYE